MAENATPAFDQNALNQAVAGAIAAAMPTIAQGVAESLKPSFEKLTPAPASAATAADSGKEKPLTASELTRMLNERDAANGQKQRATAATQRFIADKMKDIDPVFLRDVPNTENLTELAAYEQRVRGEVQSFNTRHGIKAPPVGAGANGASPAQAGTQGAAPAGNKIDLDKMTPEERMRYAFRQEIVKAPEQPSPASPAAN